MTVPAVNDVNRSLGFTLNMDQTLMWYAMNEKITIKSYGSRSVDIRNVMGDSKCVTITITITIMASGHHLPSLLVFKGAKRGRSQLSSCDIIL